MGCGAWLQPGPLIYEARGTLANGKEPENRERRKTDPNEMEEAVQRYGVW